MNPLHYKAIQRGVKVWNRYSSFCRSIDPSRRADLQNADLRGADLCGADLRGANLRGANFREAFLRGANLREADLDEADLSGADLRGAYMRGANLCGANLCGANLWGADMRGANLCGANLCGADLSGAFIGGADLTDCKPGLACPQEGQFEAWKKCKDGVIVKLSIPADARRSSATSCKCRAEFVDVLEVIGAEVGVSAYNRETEYRAGQRVTCDSWDDCRWHECAGGIHFFMCREEAEGW